MAEKPPALTPMMQQYMSIRRELDAETLLLFRLGDFYEIFLDDAERGARLLGITLTQRNGMQMAGIPYHAADTYLQKLLDRGIKVAICDQVETPQPGKLVERRLTRIITPGTRLEESQVEAGANQFLAAFDASRTGVMAAWLDVTTGEFGIAHEASVDSLAPILTGLDAREWIVPEKGEAFWATLPNGPAILRLFEQLSEGRSVTRLPDYQFENSEGERLTLEILKVFNLEGFGVERAHPALGAAGAVLAYATETLCARPANLRAIRLHRAETSLLLDPATQRNLEIFRTSANQRSGSLLDAMDATVTPAGARLLERWLGAPPRDLAEIRRRQEGVHEFVKAPGLSSELQGLLRRMRDIERILSRLQNRLQNPRELGGIRDTLRLLPQVSGALLEFPDTPVAQIAGRIGEFSELEGLLHRALGSELPGNLQEGGIIADGFDEALDRLRGLMRNNRDWLSELEQSEQAATGIKNLRIRYNNAVGYFIEVTRSNLGNVPDHYIRKQTMKNAERFYTEVLKEREREILHAEERSIQRETELFAELVEAILAEAGKLRDTASALAEIDVLLAWAQLARDWNYCKPVVDDSDRLKIEQGRHPVVEQTLRAERQGLAGAHAFVPNDTVLASSGGEEGVEAPQIALVTGPNMAGKSTYIRQVALIALMAQVGAWVPASRCAVGLVDRIFSRVGASDELARGNSTFMVEMNETANILNNATERSLIILDEIGRGTSTYDGLSIAWAVIEHLHDAIADRVGPRTLFATHYHELTQLANRLGRLHNFTVVVKEWNDDIIFVRQVVPGAADRSYGIQVARLAGLPDKVIDRARSILEKLEADDSSHNLLRKRLKRRESGRDTEDLDRQLSLF